MAINSNEYLSFLDGPYFQRGLLSRVKIGNDFKIKSTVTGRLYPLSQNGLQLAFFDTAKIGINETQILAGSALDPFGYEHLGQTNVLNEFLEKASSNTVMQQALDDIGLSSLTGRRIEVERLAYSDIGSIKHGESEVTHVTGEEPKGLRLRLKELHESQKLEAKIMNPNYTAGGTESKYIALPEISLEGALNEQESTWGFLTTRENNAVALRYRFLNEDGAVTYLTQSQYTKLSVAIGGEAVSRSAMQKIGLPNPAALSENMDSLINYNPLQQLGALFQKLDKRISASTSSRDLSLAGEEVTTLVEEAIQRIKTKNPELYKRLVANDALPTRLDDLFIKTDFTQSRLLESFKLINGKSLFEDFTEKSIARNAKDELSLTANLRIIKGVGQDELNISAESIRGILAVGGVDESGFQALGIALNQYYEYAKSTVGGGYVSKGGANFKIDDFIEHLKTLDKPGSNQFAIIARKLEDGERIYDGSGVLADYAVRHKLASNNKQIKELQAIITTHHGDPVAGEAEILAKYGEGYGIEHVKTRLKVVKNASEKIAASHDDLTARIGLSQGGVKAVLDIRNISHVSDDLGVIGFGSKELFKKETNFGRADYSIFGEAGVSGQYITLDSARHFPGERVFSDIQASIFHPEVYGNQALVAQVQENMKLFETEVTRMKETGVVPDSILKKIERQASLNPDDFEQLGFQSRIMAMRYRQDALEIQTAIANGVRPTELPALLNKVIKTSSKEVFREGKRYKYGMKPSGEVNYRYINAAVLPNAQRHAVDTEENLIGRGLKSSEIKKDMSFSQTIGLGRKTEDTLLINKNAHREIGIDLGNGEETLRMAKYRHDDHKIVVGGSTLDELYEAKGGFDLDDKFITDLHYITSNEIGRDGNPRKRLAAFSFRQPTGPEEFSILAPQMDNKTLSRMFGGQEALGENFRTALLDFSDQMDMSTGVNLLYTNKNKDSFGTLLTESLSKLSKEEAEDFRAVRYLNAISRNNMTLADIYRNGENGYITDDVVEDMIIRVQEKARGGKGLFNELSQNLIGKTIVDPATKVRLSTARQLTETDLKNNPELLSAYRDSRRIQIQNSSLTISEDQTFVDRIKNLVDSNRHKAVFDNDYLSGASFEEHAKFYKEFEIDGKALNWSENTTAHYLANLGVRSGDRGVGNVVLEEMSHLKTRLAELATTEESGNLGSYVNTLGFTSSFERQMDDILKSSSMTPDDVTFFKSHYFAYDPESAIDAAIGGNAKITMTEFFEEVAASQKYFETAGGGVEAAEESTAKAFFQLYNLKLKELQPPEGETADSLRLAGYDKNWKSFFDSKAAKVLDEYEGLEAFTLGLQDSTEKIRIMEAIDAQTIAISKNMIRQTGVEFGKMSSAFYSGRFGSDESLKMGMDDMVFRLKGSQTEDVEEFLQGIMLGHEAYIKKYGATLSDEAVRDAEEFYQFIDSNRRNWTRSPIFDRGESFHSVQQGVIKRLLEDDKFGLAYKGNMVDKYGSTSLESSMSNFAKRILDLQTGRDGSTSFSNLLSSKSQSGRDMNTTGSISAITERNLLKEVGVEIDGEIHNLNLIQEIQKLNTNINAVTNNLNFNSKNINKDVENLISEDIASIIAKFHSPSDKLGYVEAELTRQRDQYESIARSLIYGHLEEQLTSENPVDARSLLEYYYIESQRLTASKDQGTRALGELMDKSLTMGEPFFKQVGENGQPRIQLGEAYAAVKSDLINKVSEQVAKDEQMFHSLISKLEESAGEKALDADKSVSERLQEILNSRSEHSIEAGTNEKGGFVGTDFEDIFPDLKTKYGDTKGTSIRDLIEETMLETEGVINEQQAKKLEHFTQLMHSSDKATTLNLIRTDLLNESGLLPPGGIGPIKAEAQEAERKYLRDLSLMEARFNARRIFASEEALSVLSTYERAIENPIPIFNDIAARLLKDSETSGIAGIPGATGPIYTRISDKFPNFFNYVKGNKTKIAIGLGIAALGGAVYNQTRKKDHTAEGVAGPPLLPGGSAYERPATETMEYPSFSPASNGDLGVSYNVDVAGSQDQMQKFINASQSVSESGSNATIYSGIPNVGKDPYQEIASSY